MEEQNQSPTLLLTFVADNSASMQAGKLAELMPAFRNFAAGMTGNPNVEFELILFDTFAPAVAKSFDLPAVHPVSAGKMPFLGRAIDMAYKRLFEREAALTAEGKAVFRPWMFILSDGMTLDAMEESVNRLDSAERAGKLMYLPFRLSPKLISERLHYLDRTKHMIEIIPGHIADFFAFVAKMADLRRTLPADAPMKFSKSDFEGWALL